MPEISNDLRRTVGPVLLLALVAAAWGGILGGGFRFDDLPNIVYDPATREGAVFLDRLGWGLRPLLRASYFFDHALWGWRAAGWLATQLLLHAATVLGVWALARRRLPESAALLAAALFAVQPAHAEAVAYLSGRSVLLSSALLVSALLAHERSQDSAGPAGAWHLASLGAFALAVLTRETALVFPLLLLAWEGTRTEGPRLRSLLPAFVAAAVLGLLLALLPRYQVLGAYSADLRSPGASLLLNLAALPTTLSLWFRPWALSLVHPIPEVAAGSVLLGLGIVAALAALALLGRRRGSLPALGAAWVILSLAPTHSLVARRDLVTERHLYLAWMGPSLVLGGLWARLEAGQGSRLLGALGAGLLLGGGLWASQQRAALWRDEVALWSDTVVKAPLSALAWNNLGAARKEAGDIPRAAAAFRRALELDPDDRTARFNLLALEMTSFRALDSGSPP
ncbi:MAG: glycosyltransferase family 39 protein [Acidobacteria bacterium]|nr:glycosyltransferase family 39 protein [Acidobacteriota bacterium]